MKEFYQKKVRDLVGRVVDNKIAQQLRFAMEFDSAFIEINMTRFFGKYNHYVEVRSSEEEFMLLIDILFELRMELLAACFSFLEASPPERIFQKRSVSSAAAVTTVCPSGDCAMCSTRDVCPVSSATLTIDGYFQRMSWLCE